MGGEVLSPRMKMVAMMYLVLTALLAMNVSKDILDAFIIVNNGIENTNENFEKKNLTAYSAFDKAKMNDATKVTPFWNKAQKVKSLADALDIHIDELKLVLIFATDKVTEEDNPERDSLRLKHVAAKDNYDVPTHIMIGEPGKSTMNKGQWSANELKLMIAKYHDDLLKLLSPKMQSEIILSLDTSDPKKKKDGSTPTWEDDNFYHIPISAVITILTSIQSNVRNAESDIVSKLLSAVSADDFKFDTLAARIIPKSSYVFLGEDYEAEIFVAAFNTTQDPVIQIGKLDTVGGGLAMVEGSVDSSGVSTKRGSGHYKRRASVEGEVKYEGLISIKKPNGDMQPYMFSTSYIVAKPSLTVSADKMNVFYVGLDNPVSISVPGVAHDKVKPRCNGANMRKGKGKGKYIVKPTKAGKAIISVSADFDGNLKPMGKAEFRVKMIPDPTPLVAGKPGGLISRNKLAAAGAVTPIMKNFDFDVYAKMVSFTLTILVDGDLVEEKIKGGRVNAKMTGLIKKLSRGSKVYYEDIRVSMPDGTKRPLSPVIFKIR
ncbi:MAG: gliding motility protein GldM [Flavobacteriales bacterium]|nr:gliding motility protein GldM [Flavobacteriales bacterium]